MDAFNVLQRGLRFDKRRFAEDIQAFRAPAQTADAGAERASVLDFFGDDRTAAATAASMRAGSRATAPSNSSGGKQGRKRQERQEPGQDAADGNRKGKKGKKEKKGSHGDASSGIDEEGAATGAPVATMTDEEIQLLRKQHRITLKGADVPPLIRCFTDLTGCGIGEGLLTALVEAHALPTPVQM